MPLSAGDKLGPYQIVAQIGAGGMGEVYRARDARLARDVAVKVLPLELADDPARRARLEQEARALAALNHPNIVAVHDIGAQGDVTYLVEEVIDGEPLRTMLDRGELTLRKALSVAGQVAEALSAAHQAGIIHRDLKPENIMITAQGRVKVLDFGLARQSGAIVADAEGRTRTVAVTQDGAVLGTMGYMSPEQVRGRAADGRSDIFSLGVVLYEMLASQRAFHRDTAADTLSAILKEDPEELPSSVPAGVRQLVLHCLEKDPINRFQSAQDLAFAIQALGGSSVSTQAPTLAYKPPPRHMPWALVAVAAAGTLAGLLAGARVAAVPAIDLSRQHHTLVVSEAATLMEPRWAPDGKSFTYADPSHILVQNIDAAVPTELGPLQSIFDLDVPFFSPDGSRVWYTSSHDNRSVWSIGAAGGDPQPVLRNLGGFSALDGAALSLDGRSLVVAQADDSSTSLAVSSPPGAPLKPFLGAPVVHASFSRVRLRFSHDGAKLMAVCVGSRRAQEGGIWIVSWPPGNHASRKLNPVLPGEAVDDADWLLDNRHIIAATTTADTSLSGGRLALIDTDSDSVWPLTPDNSDAADPSVGPDGRILYARLKAPYDLVETPVDGSPQRELLATDWTESFGAWSRTADELVYVSDRGGRSAVWISSANGSWQRKAVTSKDVGETSGVSFRSPEFSPDGRRISYVAGRRAWISPVSGGHPTSITPPDQIAINPTWSADGRWIAYRSSGLLLKVQVGSSAPPVRIAATEPVPTAWSPDGKWLTAGVDGGIGVVSPDGAVKHVLFKRQFLPFQASLGWSRDGTTLFLLESASDHPRLSAADVQKGTARVIRDYPPDSRNYGEVFYASGRLYPSRDGKYLLGSRYSIRSSISLLEGVEPPRSFWHRLLQ